MSERLLFARLQEQVSETGLASRPGKLLYSGPQTLRPGVLYLLGYNPGGDPEAENASVRSQLDAWGQRQGSWNEFLDECWRPRGKLHPPGEAPLQRRVIFMLRGLGYDVRTVCAANLIFVRSVDAESLEDGDELAEKCWRVHELILNVVRPSCIVAFGGEVSSFILSKAQMTGSGGAYPSGHGNWGCSYFRMVLQGRDTGLISLPHLSRYAIDRHPDVVEWMRGRISDL